MWTQVINMIVMVPIDFKNTFLSLKTSASFTLKIPKVLLASHMHRLLCLVCY